jgi:hypothetical protein
MSGQSSAAASGPSPVVFLAAFGVALTLVGAALGLGVRIPPTIVVLAFAAIVLLGAIIALWNSVRSLTGDLELGDSWDQLSVESRGASGLEEQKRAVLRALKDLESEHAIGKIDDEDYAVMAQRYREEAKSILRKLDTAVEPFRAEAEALAAAHLQARGLDPASAIPDLANSSDPRAVVEPESIEASESDADADATELGARERSACATCSTSNEPDAKFCKSCGATLAEEMLA